MEGASRKPAGRAAADRQDRAPALPYREVGTFIEELRKQPGIGAKALEFAILTAARSGEVRGTVWSEFDLEAGLWTVPGERMKAHREHRVSLCARAVDLVKAMQGLGKYVFFGARVGRPLSDMTLTAVLRRMGRGDLTAHGFRSTFRDWVAEQTAYPREVAEMALAHTVGSGVEAAYRRGDLYEKRVRLMNDWAAYCAQPARSLPCAVQFNACKDTLYTSPMIRTFRHKGLEAFFHSGSKAGIQPAHAKRLRLQLAMLDTAKGAKDMELPAWRLHPLSGDLAGHWSVWVSGNWRLTFTFEDGDAVLVDYQDCH